MIKNLLILLLLLCALPLYAKTIPNVPMPTWEMRDRSIPATGLFIKAGSICDTRYSNLRDYSRIITTNYSNCYGQTIYVKETVLFYTALSLGAFFILILTFVKRKRIKELLLMKLF